MKYLPTHVMAASTVAKKAGSRRVFALNFGSEILDWRDGALYPLAGGSRWRGESGARCRCDWRGEVGGRLWRQRRERAAELGGDRRVWAPAPAFVRVSALLRQFP
jgi:hypothetical protein